LNDEKDHKDGEKELEMKIKRNGTQPSKIGPAEWFTGTERFDHQFDATEPGRVECASVTFEPGSRTAWHTHPLVQTLIITTGCGWVQRWDSPVEKVHPGDVFGLLPVKNTGMVPPLPQ
jgi:quercetin dioxygenase-like cupin family protein